MTSAVNTRFFDEPHHERSIEGALNRANSSSNRVFLRFGKTLNLKDVWPKKERSMPQRQWHAAWSDGRGDQRFWAVGCSAKMRCGETIRFGRAHRNCSEICEQTMDVSLVGPEGADWSRVPMAVGGFSFAPRQKPATEIWEGWEDGVLWIPRLLFYQQGSETGVCLTLVVEPGDSPEAIRETLIISLAELEGELSRFTVCGLSQSGSRSEAPPLSINAAQMGLPARGKWCERVERARAAIREGAFDKVVLARSEEWHAPLGFSFDAFQTAHRLREEYPTCKVFLFQQEDGSAFVGATPELLLGLKGAEVEAVSLAGTTRRGHSVLEDEALGEALVASAKDQHEHRLVTEAIRQSFEPVVENLEIGKEPHLLKLHNVQHLETPIRARLDRTRGIMELVSRLHPTPAVGGTPSLKAQRWLEENESLERGWYAGLVGFVTSGGDGLFAVAIRSAMMRPDRAWAFAGAGLVADSDPELEWEETALKLQAMCESFVVRSVETPAREVLQKERPAGVAQVGIL